MKKTTTSSRTAAPPLTDPLLAALLLYIDGTDPEDGDYANEVALARRLLHSTANRCHAFTASVDHPHLWSELFDAIAAEQPEMANFIAEIRVGPGGTGMDRYAYETFMMGITS